VDGAVYEHQVRTFVDCSESCVLGFMLVGSNFYDGQLSSQITFAFSGMNVD